MRILNHYCSGRAFTAEKVAREAALARLAGSGSLVARVLRPIVNLLVPSRLTTISVLSGQARGIRMPVLLREEKFYWTGLYEPEVQQALAAHLKTGDTFWDLGAHAGFFTILASRLVGPEGSVVALEPLSENRERLSKAIAENRCANVSVVPAAVGARSGEANFYPARSSLMGSLVPSEGVVPTRLECVTLDDLGEEAAWPALVKIDVEGAELDVLRAGQIFLSTARPLVIVEMPDADQVTVNQAKELLGSYEFLPLGPSHQLLLPKT